MLYSSFIASERPGTSTTGMYNTCTYKYIGKSVKIESTWSYAVNCGFSAVTRAFRTGRVAVKRL